MHQSVAFIEKTFLCVLWGHENESPMFKHINRTLQRPMYFIFFFFFYSFFSLRFPIRSGGSLQAFMPATNGVTARLTNMQSLRVKRGKKRKKEKHRLSYSASPHKGPFNKPMKKSKSSFVMISLNALITPGDNSIMIVVIKWGFHQDPQTDGGKPIIPLTFRYDTDAYIMILSYLAEFMTLASIHNACGDVLPMTVANTVNMFHAAPVER